MSHELTEDQIKETFDHIVEKLKEYENLPEVHYEYLDFGHQVDLKVHWLLKIDEQIVPGQSQFYFRKWSGGLFRKTKYLLDGVFAYGTLVVTDVLGRPVDPIIGMYNEDLGGYPTTKVALQTINKVRDEILQDLKVLETPTYNPPKRAKIRYIH